MVHKMSSCIKNLKFLKLISKTQLKISLQEYYNTYINDVQGLMKLTYTVIFLHSS